MDDLINEMSRQLIEIAKDKVIYRFEFPLTYNAEVPESVKSQMKHDAEIKPITLPCAIIITAETKKPIKIIPTVSNITLNALYESGLVKEERIRQFAFARKSSFEETVEVFIVTLPE